MSKYVFFSHDLALVCFVWVRNVTTALTLFFSTLSLSSLSSCHLLWIWTHHLLFRSCWMTQHLLRVANERRSMPNDQQSRLPCIAVPRRSSAHVPNEATLGYHPLLQWQYDFQSCQRAAQKDGGGERQKKKKKRTKKETVKKEKKK